MNNEVKSLLKRLTQETAIDKIEKRALASALEQLAEELDHKSRELEIETALEKVRSRTLAMQHSEELSATSFLLFEQLKELGEVAEQISIGIYHEDTQMLELYATIYGNQWNQVGKIPYNDNKIHTRVYSAWKSGEKSVIIDLSGKELDDFNRFKMKISTQYKSEEEVPKGRWIIHVAFFKKGALIFSTKEPRPSATMKLLERFADAFDLTYTRFLDLKQAEAQAREARLEAALEKVRGVAMAMHTSSDLSSTASLVFSELRKLNIHPIRTGVVLFEHGSVMAKVFAATSSSQSDNLALIGNMNGTLHPCLERQHESWEKQENYFTHLKGEELSSYYEVLNQNLKIPLPVNQAAEAGEHGYYFAFTQGSFYAWTLTPYNEDEISLLNRFKNIIDLTFRRYFELRAAEAQAHKAQMEAAMERVRSRALAMTDPEEILEVARMLRHEMGLLGVEEIETGTIFIFDENTETAQFGFTAKDKRQAGKEVVTDHVVVDLHRTTIGKNFLSFFKSEEQTTTIRMTGAERAEWVKYIYSLSPKTDNYFGDKIPDMSYHLHKFSNGAVGAACLGTLSVDMWDLLKRASSVFSLAYSRYKDLSNARADLERIKEEKKRSEALLLNILPEEIAAELKQFGKSYARKHEQVTVLFADIQGFSEIAENLSADELVTQLDECFRAFDKIVEKNQMEKIKTVGDAYVCASGLPRPVPDNAVRAVKAALDMVEFIKGFGITKKIQNLPAFEFRIGIHTGPVVTGVVGLKKFTYDIWGDAVNMAARMEQHGEAGKINISETTYELVKERFRCYSRGKVKAKNKGEVEMYFVER